MKGREWEGRPESSPQPTAAAILLLVYMGQKNLGTTLLGTSEPRAPYSPTPPQSVPPPHLH